MFETVGPNTMWPLLESQCSIHSSKQFLHFEEIFFDDLMIHWGTTQFNFGIY